MSEATSNDHRGRDDHDLAPGDEEINQHEPGGGLTGYLIGLALAGGLTAASFLVLTSTVIWQPAIPAALIALAIAQMGVHLVFFLHITTGPDNTNNVLALAFGVLIVGLVLLGSMWIMAHLSHQVMPMGELMNRMR
ncbi:cytochrome o ubiquinol oxidase subunit IV [Sphingomonas sp. KRR8]|uniref:cytochrome o ubiquinol oxidase subunit IV n=1 Tax=Sphingomonas sp. KRR8 TaxID=2942996 RepID=UPI0020219E75|nr:cytochrome o ubiquinol oxidase subunit IV [Sphingomonas sp. KRR8]URD62048.1 cytochrome o ubiquinol oxidase subunit IV [Sphingomonas sp. KRR8]